MAKRKYEKKNKDYWNKFNKNKQTKLKPAIGPAIASGINPPLVKDLKDVYTPKMVGDPFYQGNQTQIAQASSRRVLTKDGDNSDYRITRRHTKVKPDEYSNIREGLLPYQSSKDGVDMREAIILCQKAYANVAVFRLAIEIMAELSNSVLKLKGGSAKSRKFIKSWLKKVGIRNLKDQFFREYYRSGNVFTHRIDGQLEDKDYNNLRKKYGLKEVNNPKIPLRYIFMNPYDIMAEHASSFSDSTYKKMLSQYQIEALKNPKTEKDKLIFKSLSPEDKNRIKTNQWQKDGIQIKLDPKVISYSFYKKQDYEPFAIPFGFPVLKDINWKLELKKIDQAVCRTIENAILLITMGSEDNPQPAAINAMQELFATESVGRVLVADYTVKADFIIPDIEKIIGPEKYKIVNEDIKQGLQNVIVGDEKHSNTQIKAQIFLERLKESRDSFLEDFMQNEIERVCKNVGLRDVPEAIFEEIDIKDEVQLQRVASRLIELGILTPEQGMDTIKTGVYPDPEELEEAQKKFLEQREKGYFNPIVGGEPVLGDDEEVVDPVKKSSDKKKKTKKQAGRPGGTDQIKQEKPREFSQSKIAETISEISKFHKESLAFFKRNKKIKKMSSKYKGLIDNLCETIVISTGKDDWQKVFESCVIDFNKIGEIEAQGPNKSVLEISEEHNLTQYAAALLWHSEVK